MTYPVSHSLALDAALPSSAGVILGLAGASSGGGREVSSVYAEMLLPFTSTLEADIAGRYEKYSDYGNNFAPKIALRWHPIDSLTLHGSVGRGLDRKRTRLNSSH